MLLTFTHFIRFSQNPPMFQWRIQIPVRIKQDPECSVVLNKIISAGTLCPFSTKIMSPTLSSELAIDTCPLLVNLQYLDEFQGKFIKGYRQKFRFSLISGAA